MFREWLGYKADRSCLHGAFVAVDAIKRAQEYGGYVKLVANDFGGSHAIHRTGQMNIHQHELWAQLFDHFNGLLAG